MRKSEPRFLSDTAITDRPRHTKTPTCNCSALEHLLLFFIRNHNYHQATKHTLQMHSTSSMSSTALHAGLHAFLPSSSIVSTQQPCQQPTQEVQRSVRAKFILKLHSIITLPNAEIIQWSSDGRSFTIKHPALFQEQLLSEIFSHNTYASFERQLHFYS